LPKQGLSQERLDPFIWHVGDNHVLSSGDPHVAVAIHFSKAGHLEQLIDRDPADGHEQPHRTEARLPLRHDAEVIRVSRGPGVFRRFH
jgi:hypothetical protein